MRSAARAAAGVEALRRLRRALSFALLRGQASELGAAAGLLATARSLGHIRRVVYDRGYSSDRWSAAIRTAGAEPVVPASPPTAVHRVENLWARLEEWHAVASRYDKTAASLLGAVHFAAAIDWLANGP